MKNWDLLLATIGGTGTLALVNSAIGTAIGLLTLFVLLFRARREWHNRNRPPED